jgi:peptidoglycan-N-acetylglucosamine deacetylase
VKRIHEEGHTIGNHSYHHKNNIAFISTKKLIEEVRLCSITLEKIIGEKIKLFRPPVGITNPNFARMLTVLGLTSIGWNVRTYDTKIVEAQKLLAFLKSNTKNGNIILLHDTMEVTASILDSYLSDATNKGFTFERINFG